MIIVCVGPGQSRVVDLDFFSVNDLHQKVHTRRGVVRVAYLRAALGWCQRESIRGFHEFFRRVKLLCPRRTIQQQPGNREGGVRPSDDNYGARLLRINVSDIRDQLPEAPLS